MKVLIDTNVALDIMLNRQNFTDSFTVFNFAEKGVLSGYISASAITDIFYIAEKVLGKNPTKKAVKDILLVNLLMSQEAGQNAPLHA